MKYVTEIVKVEKLIEVPKIVWKKKQVEKIVEKVVYKNRTRDVTVNHMRGIPYVTEVKVDRIIERPNYKKEIIEVKTERLIEKECPVKIITVETTRERANYVDKQVEVKVDREKEVRKENIINIKKVVFKPIIKEIDYTTFKIEKEVQVVEVPEIDF